MCSSSGARTRPAVWLHPWSGPARKLREVGGGGDIGVAADGRALFSQYANEQVDLGLFELSSRQLYASLRPGCRIAGCARPSGRSATAFRTAIPITSKSSVPQQVVDAQVGAGRHRAFEVGPVDGIEGVVVGEVAGEDLYRHQLVRRQAPGLHHALEVVTSHAARTSCRGGAAASVTPAT